MSHRPPAIQAIESTLTRDFPEFRPGDRVRVHALISEGNKERIQIFEGVCIHKSKRGAQQTFTVRKVSDGVGVERVFMTSSPRVTKVELVTRGRVRRAKLYYLRGRSGNSARIREKIGDYKSNIARAQRLAEASGEGADGKKKKRKRGKKRKAAARAAREAEGQNG